ncbi:MAG: hypothetical protein HYR90_02340 [Candidatus Andersenbacteria bacterium]|nr:hypothetical protein [Candidatus Andersenbacteria bacterium]MBI3250998.1 hypothetical protein [Candidatus Andersenbacteria bacterium]
MELVLLVADLEKLVNCAQVGKEPAQQVHDEEGSDLDERHVQDEKKARADEEFIQHALDLKHFIEDSGRSATIMSPQAFRQLTEEQLSKIRVLLLNYQCDESREVVGTHPAAHALAPPDKEQEVAALGLKIFNGIRITKNKVAIA